MSFKEISKEINNVSTFSKYLSKNKIENVRPSALVKNNDYLLFIYNHVKTESPYVYVKFIGSGRSPNNILPHNIKIIDIQEEYYWFEAYDCDMNETYIFGAHKHDNKLCVTNSSRRISFKKLLTSNH